MTNRIEVGDRVIIEYEFGTGSQGTVIQVLENETKTYLVQLDSGKRNAYFRHELILIRKSE